MENTVRPRNAAVYPSLRGRRVLVTGGASGIGASLVEGFGEQGAHVAFVDRDVSAATALVERLGASGAHRPSFAECDLADVTALRSAVRSLAGGLGGFEVLVANAANDDRHRLEDLEPEYWDRCLDVNLRHQIFAVQAVAPGMRAHGGGSIVLMGSVSWMLGNAGYVGYACAKAAIHGATRVLARELGAERIRVNCVVPGLVMTQRQKRWHTEEAVASHVARQCLPDVLVPDDIARMVLFLAADDSRGCTGQDFIVDAGVA